MGGSERFDVAVIGAGPAGLAAGARAAALGVSHVVLERGKLADTVHRYQKRKHVMATPDKLPLRPELGLAFAEGSREQVLDAWERGTRTAGTNIKLGPQYDVTRIEGEKGAFTLHLKDGSTLGAANVVLAIGLQGNLRPFGVSGDHLPHVTYQLDDPDDHEGKKVIVVGVGDAGIENALALAEHNDVGIVNRRDEFPRAKPRNRALIEAAIKQRRVHHHTYAEVKRIEPGCVILETRAGEARVECDLLIGRLGGLPPRAFLESIGIAFGSADRAAVPVVSASYESSVAGIYVVGSLAGYSLIKHCLNQGCEVVDHIVGNAVVPADEPLLRQSLASVEGTVDDILDRIRATVALFAGVTRLQLRDFLVDSTARRFEPGEVIYRRNDFSDAFYSILDGWVEVVAPAADGSHDGREAAARLSERRIRLDAGQFFGEMSLISGRRRSGTVVAGEGCVVLETPRLSVIKLLSSVPAVKRLIDNVFILRKLQTTLAPEVPVEDLAELASAAVIETYKQGDVLFSEGDASDGLHLIRRGSVTVSRRRGDGEQILAYLPAGNIVGEMALSAPRGRRQATVKAAILTETIRLPTDAIGPFVARHDALAQRLAKLADDKSIENALRATDRKVSGAVDFLMTAGLGEATDVLLIDESLCIRCDNCERACAETHGGVSRLDREAGPTYATIHVPTSCRHCENPKCMTDCPPDALSRTPEGEIAIDAATCIGCNQCADNCPYGVIQMAATTQTSRWSALWSRLLGRQGADGGKKIAVKCDLCEKLQRNSRRPVAACVAGCPTGAILRVNPKEYVDRLMRAADA